MPRRRNRTVRVRRKSAARRMWDALRTPDRRNRRAQRRANELHRQAEEMARQAQSLAGSAGPKDRRRVEALQARLDSWYAAFQSVPWHEQGLSNADLSPAYGAYGRAMSGLSAASRRIEAQVAQESERRVQEAEARAQEARRDAERRAQEAEARAQAREREAALRPELSGIQKTRRPEHERARLDQDLGH